MKIRWSLPAAEDLERICAWIERDNPEAARRVAKFIYEGCGQLKDFPNMGRASHRLSGRRELAFPPLPYIAVYQVKEDTVEISRIFHGRRTGRSALTRQKGDTSGAGRRRRRNRPHLGHRITSKNKLLPCV